MEEYKGWMYGVSLILGVLGLPKLWELITSLISKKNEEYKKKYEDELALRLATETDLSEYKEKLKENNLVLKLTIMELETHNHDDPNTLRLLDFLKENSSFNITPART